MSCSTNDHLPYCRGHLHAWGSGPFQVVHATTSCIADATQAAVIQHTCHCCCVQVGFQMGFTTVFGWYASFLLLRTGHFVAPLCAHVFCNFMGFPDFFAAARHPRAALLKTLYLTGIVAFAVLLRPLSSPMYYSNVLSEQEIELNLYAQTASYLK